MKTLLIEIGTEEIPAGYIQPALDAFSANIVKKLSDNRIACGTEKTYGTPRRLTVSLSDVANKQASVTSDVMGPPTKISFDETGQPTVAAQKFAEKVGVAVGRLTQQETPKGSYLCAKVTERGQATKTILKQILPQVILSLPFPKTMRWSDMSLSFARPVISLLVLLGKEVVTIQLDRLKSGRWTYGHSTMSPKKITLKDPLEYVDILRSAQVIVDFEERKQRVSEQIAEAAQAAGGSVLVDPELLDTVTNLVEYPVAVVGSFEKSFLELPKEILITSMREHQKYFAVVDSKGDLMPYFIAINNTCPKDLGLVQKGHERVLRARLEDARFFYRSDLKETMDAWQQKLHGVLFQAKLGSVYEKVERIGTLSNFLVQHLPTGSEISAHVSQAATYCKADLVSQVVGEFPKLQGIMGRVYATAAGMSDEAATAIEEHYRPLYSGGTLPETRTGAIVALADKIDSICGCFYIGLIPTGAADPYALRRQGIGALQIMLQHQLMIPLRNIIDASAAVFSEKLEASSPDTVESVLTFLKNRMAHLLAEDGFSKDVVAAVLNTSDDQIPHIWKKVAALEALKNRPDFEPLAIAFKRVVNIIRKADPTEGQTVAENLFEDASESALFTAYHQVKKAVEEALEQGQFESALLAVASLRKAVDAFFDGVLVMSENHQIRKNRLGLLRCIASLFGDLADFSKIST